MVQVRSGRIYEFDDFQLRADERLLLRRGEPVALHGKAFEMLLVLVRNRGRLLTKDELFGMVWPDQIVEESNLTVNMSAIRRALGERANNPRYITTVSGRGYRFTEAVREMPSDEGELVIESQTFSRVVVEQEEVSDTSVGYADVVLDDSNGEEGGYTLPAGRKIELAEQREVKLLTSPSSVGARRGSHHRRLVVGGLLTVLFVIAGFGLWRYRDSNATSVALPRIPFQQIDIKRLTNLGNVANAALSPDGKLFVYSLAEKDGRRSLWLGHAEGGEPKQIRSPAEVIHQCLTFAPDGSSLYFTESADFSPGTLYRMPVFGGAPEKTKENIPNDITFAPDGKRFAFVRADGANYMTSLFVADVGNATEHEVASRPNSLGFVADNPAWSPDGSLIAIGAVNNEGSRKQEIFVVRVVDGSVRQLTALDWTGVYAIQWLKDSSGLIVVAKGTDAAVAAQLWHVSSADGAAHRIVADLNTYGSVLSLSTDNNALLTMQAQGYTNIWVAPADELSGAKQITFGTRNIGSYGLDWTPDSRIVHTAYVGQSQTIWAMDAGGGTQKQLLPTGHTDNSLSVTVDGRYLVFQSNRGGGFEVWRADADGSKMQQLTTGGNNSQPHVSPDGKWIVYKSDREGSGALWRVSIDGGEPARVTEQAASWPRVSPDGRLIACGYNIDGKLKLAIVPIEGGRPIKLFDVPRLASFSYGMRWTPDGKGVTYHDWANGIWKQTLDGGTPQRLAGLPEEKLFAHSWSRDGKLFAFARGAQIRDVVLIRDLR